MNRARRIMAEWDARTVDCGGVTPGDAHKHDELTQLQKKLADKTSEYTRLQEQLDASRRCTTTTLCCAKNSTAPAI